MDKGRNVFLAEYLTTLLGAGLTPEDLVPDAHMQTATAPPPPPSTRTPLFEGVYTPPFYNRLLMPYNISCKAV